MIRFATIFILIILSCHFLIAQQSDILGDWYGTLSVGGTQLGLVFHITETDGTLTATMDSPDQGANGIPVQKTSYDQPEIVFDLSNIGIRVVGTVKSDQEIDAILYQAGMEIPLLLGRTKAEKKIVLRPQEPKSPFPYRSEDVIFHNATADIDLSGTLTLPEGDGPYPAVVLISGSGPQDRNSEILEHKPFLVIADHLSRQGIAVLRFDDRGVGESGGIFQGATSQDFATDVQAAVHFLSQRAEINQDAIGLIGHSEGGIIAPMAIAADERIDFAILLGAPGLDGTKILLEQSELIAKVEESPVLLTRIGLDVIKIADRLNRALPMDESMTDSLRSELETYFDQLSEEDQQAIGHSKSGLISQYLLSYNSPWMRNFMKYDPAPVLEKITIPVLAITGEKDLQVPPSSNLPVIEAALKKAGNENYQVEAVPGLNHLFQKTQTGRPSEYHQIEETFSPDVLKKMSDWISSLN